MRTQSTYYFSVPTNPAILWLVVRSHAAILALTYPCQAESEELRFSSCLSSYVMRSRRLFLSSRSVYRIDWLLASTPALTVAF